MATTSLQAAIDIANRRHKAANSRRFLQKASDTQMLEHLAKLVVIAIDAYREDYKKGLRCSTNLHEALRELDGFLSLVGKHLERSGAGSGR